MAPTFGYYCYDQNELLIDSFRIQAAAFVSDYPITDRMVLSSQAAKNGGSDLREAGLASYNCAQGKCGDPINTATGGFSYGWMDLSLATVAGPLAFERTYASLGTSLYTTTLGYGWTHNHDTRLILPNSPGGETGVVWFKAHSANQYRFDIQVSGGVTTYVPYPGLLTSLSAVGSTLVLTTTNQSIYTFDSTGLLLDWQDARGFGFEYSYDQGRLITVTEPVSMRWIRLNYDGQGRISAVHDSANRQVLYGYDGSGDLATITDTLSQTWTYTYTAPHLLDSVIDPRPIATLRTEYDEAGRAWRQFDGMQASPVVTVTYGTDTATIIDGRGNSVTHVYDIFSTLTTLVSAK